jgi:hypothetical protein
MPGATVTKRMTLHKVTMALDSGLSNSERTMLIKHPNSSQRTYLFS